MTIAPSLSGRVGRVHVLLLVLVLAAAVVPRVPALVNAPRELMADEAVDALVVKHLLERGELTLYNWDTTYYGIVEGVLTIPFVLVMGMTPLAFKLGAVALFLALVAAVFLLGAQIYGPGEGLVAAALLAAFSPQLVRWSTLAAGGFALLVAWGTLTLCQVHVLRSRQSRLDWVALGFLVGFGLYIYELYLVYVAVLAGAALVSSFAWRALVARSAETRRAALGLAGRQIVSAALFALGFLIGWAPKLAAVLGEAGGDKEPVYALAGPAKIAANARLLVDACLPAFFGVNPSGSPELVEYVGSSGPIPRILGVAVLFVYAAAWLWALARRGREILRAMAGSPEGLSTESLLVLLVPATFLLMILSRNPQDALSNRYLLPTLSALPVLAGGALIRLRKRSLPLSLAAGLLLVAHPTAQIAAWYRDHGLLSDGLRPVRRGEPLEQVLAFLRQQGIRGGYAWYWTAYKATFLSGERIVVAPLASWDRYPAYTRQVDGLDRVAYIFHVDLEGMDPLQWTGARQNLADFRSRLESAAVAYEQTRVGPYLVYTGPAGRRLLPPSSAEPVPLADPRAEIEIGEAPAVVSPGQEVRIPVRIVNRSDAVWSATGLAMAAGSHRVAASYRWFDAVTGASVVPEGTRSLLPGDVLPGETVRMIVRAKAPEAPGTYDLAVTLVQENVGWFDQATGTAARRRIEVRPAPPGP
ncbi:MAG TPA: hypothetical protein VF756_18100 [Thermoanaerobaculia bacterium]